MQKACSDFTFVWFHSFPLKIVMWTKSAIQGGSICFLPRKNPFNTKSCHKALVRGTTVRS